MDDMSWWAMYWAIHSHIAYSGTRFQIPGTGPQIWGRLLTKYHIWRISEDYPPKTKRCTTFLGDMSSSHQSKFPCIIITIIIILLFFSSFSTLLTVNLFVLFWRCFVMLNSYFVCFIIYIFFFNFEIVFCWYYFRSKNRCLFQLLSGQPHIRIWG